MKPNLEELTALDHQYSNRHIDLDPAGYFLIYLDREAGLICAKHFSNTISDTGVALDPETGKPLPCNQKLERQAIAIFQGRTAKEIGMEITEKADPKPLTYLDHALYLGREFQKAEQALIQGTEYIQD